MPVSVCAAPGTSHYRPASGAAGQLPCRQESNMRSASSLTRSRAAARGVADISNRS